MKIKSEKDFYSGLMFLGTGVAFAWGATNYNIGKIPDNDLPVCQNRSQPHRL